MTSPQSHSSPLQVVRAMYEAFGSRDEAALRTLLANDIAWNQCAGFPGGGRHRGLDAVFSGVFQANDSNWKSFRAETDEFLESGDRVVALGHYRGTHAKTGRTMEAAFVHVSKVAGEQIIQFDQIADTWPMVSAAS